MKSWHIGWFVSILMLLQATPARAESPLSFASSLEHGGSLPTSSTKHLMVTLQLLVQLPAVTSAKLFAGLGPRAVTQELLTSNIPQLVSLGMASSLRAEF